MNEVTIYILTHKKFNEKYDKELYKPLLNGSYFINEELNYIKDNTGDNISELNPYYAELTGQYWAWKNSESDIIGFNHYRRWFVRNLKFDKLTKKDIINDLKNNDIILPQKVRFKTSLKETTIELLKLYPNYGAKWEDYLKLEQVIKQYYPEYLESYYHIMNSNSYHNNNMFICNMKLADKYFTWLFDILKIMENEIDFSKYPEYNKRALGFLSETLLNVFVIKNNLKVKKRWIFISGSKMPILFVIGRRFPRIGNLINLISKKIYALNKKAFK